MKFILNFMISFLLISYSFNSFSKSVEEEKEEKNAKAVCLMKDPLIRGQKLNDCIKKEIDEIKKSK